MNITFLIGNGFDLNLGLDTLYSDFVEDYKKLETDDDDLRKFRNHIKENEELWSNAEWELGQYTKQLGKGEAPIFSKCQKDFCEHLAEYLKKQESRVSFLNNSDAVLKAFAQIEEITQSFNSQEKESFKKVYSKNLGSDRCFRFINFNYTKTLDKCISIVKKDSKKVLKTHTYINTIYSHKITDVFHVHGTLDENMVFAVNDETQIAKTDIFECGYGEIYKNLLIKRKANNSYGEYTDENAWSLIQDSDIIYIYGMSIGDTDKLWWERICDWLSADTNRCLIVHKFSMPIKGVFPIDYQIAEEEYKDKIINKSTLDEKTKKAIRQRIHITNFNLFAGIKDIAVPLDKEGELLVQMDIDDLEKEIATVI